MVLKQQTSLLVVQFSWSLKIYWLIKSSNTSFQSLSVLIPLVLCLLYLSLCLCSISNTSENEWYLSLDSQIPWMKSIFSSHRRENIDFINGIWLFKLRYHEFSDVLFLCTLTQHHHSGYLLFRSGYLLLRSGYLLFSHCQGGYLLFSHCRTMLQQVSRKISLQHGPAAWSLNKIASSLYDVVEGCIPWKTARRAL